MSGGIGSVIGGDRSAEEILFGMATGAIVGALNHYMHGSSEPDDDDVEITAQIRRRIETSPAAQRISQSVFDENGEINIAINLLSDLGVKWAGVASNVIDIFTKYVEYIMPSVNESLNREHNAYRNYKIHSPIKISPNGPTINPPKYKTIQDINR